MRLLSLYLRSRRVPAALAAVLVSTVALWSIGLAGVDAKTRLVLAVLAAAIGTAALAPGLVGADPALDRTAALSWPPRRAGHVLAMAAVVAGVLAATVLTGDPLATATVALRNAAGLAGLVALAAAALGAGLAWLPPVAWTAVVVMVGPQAGGYREALTWMVQPGGTASATVTALAVGAAGALAYAWRGSRS